MAKDKGAGTGIERQSHKHTHPNTERRGEEKRRGQNRTERRVKHQEDQERKERRRAEESLVASVDRHRQVLHPLSITQATLLESQWMYL